MRVHTEVVAGRHRKPKAGPGRHRKPPSPGRWASPVLAGLIVLGISGVGAVTALTDHSATPVAPRSPTPSVVATTPASPTPSGTASPKPSATPSPRAASKPRNREALVITTTGRVAWVSVTVPGGRSLFAGMLRHGRTLRYGRHPLEVVIGDAGAVRLAVRGHVHARAGRSGQVLRFTIR